MEEVLTSKGHSEINWPLVLPALEFLIVLYSIYLFRNALSEKYAMHIVVEAFANSNYEFSTYAISQVSVL